MSIENFHWKYLVDYHYLAVSDYIRVTFLIPNIPNDVELLSNFESCYLNVVFDIQKTSEEELIDFDALLDYYKDFLKVTSCLHLYDFFLIMLFFLLSFVDVSLLIVLHFLLLFILRQCLLVLYNLYSWWLIWYNRPRVRQYQNYLFIH